MSESADRRRPIRARSARWPRAIPAALARAGVRPNAISMASLGFALLGAICLVGTARSRLGAAADVALFLAAGLCVQLRLLCNLLNGLVAVEGGLQAKSGEIFNELPDRLSDALFLSAAGYAAIPGGWGLRWDAGRRSARCSWPRIGRPGGGSPAVLRTDGQATAHVHSDGCVYSCCDRGVDGLAASRTGGGAHDHFHRVTRHRLAPRVADCAGVGDEAVSPRAHCLVAAGESSFSSKAPVPRLSHKAVAAHPNRRAEFIFETAGSRQRRRRWHMDLGNGF